MEENRLNTIEVTVDKSHIVTIGERLYGESIELIRELINNAYDADATEVLDKIKNALLLNPEYCPEGLIPLADSSSDTTGQPGYVSQAKGDAAFKEKEQSLEVEQKKKRKRKPIVKRLTPTAVVKKLKLGQQGVSCCIDHFGPDGPECLTEGTVIYINRDHPLYKKEVQKANTYELHIARLLTQEICLMKEPRNPRQAFQKQSKLLRDALVETKKNTIK